jgi:adenylylsulfate kinase-like enzyme
VSWTIWLTGPPASGKTTLARAFLAVLGSQGGRAVHLESDALRRILTPEATYDRAERDRFYRQLADLAALLVDQGFPVVIDATAPRREYRARARAAIANFLEVLVTAPEELRRQRDPKSLYALSARGGAPHLPGVGEPYEEPENPDLVVNGAGPPGQAATDLLGLLRRRGFLSSSL